MIKYLIRSLYLIGLFLQLLYASVPVLSPIIQIIATSFLLLFILTYHSKINVVYTRWTAAYMSFFLLSSLWALEFKVALWAVVVFLPPVLVMNFATISFVKNKNDLNQVFFIIYIVAIIMLSFIFTHLGEFVEGVRLGSSLNDPTDEKKIWNANGIAIILCFALYSGYIVFIYSKSNWFLLLQFIIIGVVMSFSILLTGSRKGLLMLVFPLFYFLMKKLKKRLFIVLLISPIIIFAIYELIINTSIFYDTIGVRVVDMWSILTNDTSGEEDTSRITLFLYGMNWFANDPLLGVGINNFRVLSTKTIEFAGRNFYAHNNYVELLVDVGILGFFVYYSIYIYLYKKLKGKKDELSQWGLVFFFIIVFLGFLEVLYYETFEQLIMCLIFVIINLNRKKLCQRKLEE